MSYARLSDKSDLYVYLDVAGWLRCSWCALGTDPDKPGREPSSYITRKTAEMVEHLAAHRDAGHKVPEGLEERLLAEAAELDAEMERMGPDDRSGLRVSVDAVISGLDEVTPPPKIHIERCPLAESNVFTLKGLPIPEISPQTISEALDLRALRGSGRLVYGLGLRLERFGQAIFILGCRLRWWAARGARERMRP